MQPIALNDLARHVSTLRAEAVLPVSASEHYIADYYVRSHDDLLKLLRKKSRA
jgi:hypothetical protein